MKTKSGTHGNDSDGNGRSVGRRFASVSMLDGTAALNKLLQLQHPRLVTTTAAASTVAEATSTSSLKTIFAQSLGGVMFAGAVFLYTPIILKLWREKNGDGMSLQTWICNTMGFTGIHYTLEL